MILLIVKRDRLVMSLHKIGHLFYKRIYDTKLQAEVEIHKRNILQPLPAFGEV